MEVTLAVYHTTDRGIADDKSSPCGDGGAGAGCCWRRAQELGKTAGEGYRRHCRAARGNEAQSDAGGKDLAYTTTVGQLPVATDAGETEAQIFFMAYTADNPTPGVQRPLLFAFNGGPGAASVWLHLGAMGPRRVQMLPDGKMPPPPFRLADNESSWLEFGDMVFIDPVGTGYSRAVKPELTQKFTTVRGDIEAVGRFIRLYLGRYERWKSPLFLVGESYGAFRASGLSEYLADHGIALNGIILVSSIMNLQTVTFDQGNDLPYVLFLPSYTATAWYHRKLAPPLQADLDKTLAEAESWAETDYATALGKGDRLTPQERRRVAEKLAALTGLDGDFVLDHNLRIDSRSFAGQLLRERQEMVGLLDSRFSAFNPEPMGRYGFDPKSAIRPPYTAIFNDYVRHGLATLPIWMLCAGRRHRTMGLGS